MSQDQILTFLEQCYPNKYTIAQLIYHLKNQGLTASVIYANVKKLKEKKEIEWEWGQYLSTKAIERVIKEAKESIKERGKQ